MSKTSPTQRTLAHFRKLGYPCAITEKQWRDMRSLYRSQPPNRFPGTFSLEIKDLDTIPGEFSRANKNRRNGKERKGKSMRCKATDTDQPYASLDSDNLQCTTPKNQESALKIAQRIIDNGELLPCPFCGCPDLTIGNTHTAYYYVECHECGAEVHGEVSTRHVHAIKTARDAWNRRA